MKRGLVLIEVTELKEYIGPGREFVNNCKDTNYEPKRVYTQRPAHGALPQNTRALCFICL